MNKMRKGREMILKAFLQPQRLIKPPFPNPQCCCKKFIFTFEPIYYSQRFTAALNSRNKLCPIKICSNFHFSSHNSFHFSLYEQNSFQFENLKQNIQIWEIICRQTEIKILFDCKKKPGASMNLNSFSGMFSTNGFSM